MTTYVRENKSLVLTATHIKNITNLQLICHSLWKIKIITKVQQTIDSMLRYSVPDPLCKKSDKVNKKKSV